MKKKYYLEDFLYKEVSHKYNIKMLDLMILIIILILGLLIRYNLFYFQSEDYIQNLQHWFATIKSNGGIFGIKYLVGNYTPPYTYMLALLTYLPFSSLTSIKLLSVLFDILLSLLVGLIVFCIKNNKNGAISAFAITFLLPTVVVNSSMWAQCDSIISFFIILSLYCFIREHPAMGCFSFGIAIAIKIQSIFLAPLLLFLWIDKRINFKHLLFIPLAYLLSVVPSALAGGNYLEALTVAYWQVTTTATNLSFNCANFWAPLSSVTAPKIAKAGTCFALSITFLTAYYIVSKKPKLDQNKIILISLFYLLLIPFFLPHMHERYYFYAEIVSIIYLFIEPKKFYYTIIISSVSLYSYLPFLFNTEIISLSILALAILFILCDLGYNLLKAIE